MNQTGYKENHNITNLQTYLTVLARERTTIPCSTVNDITETKTAKYITTDVKMSTIHRENINTVTHIYNKIFKKFVLVWFACFDEDFSVESWVM